MKHRLLAGSFLMTVVVMLVAGCLAGHANRSSLPPAHRADLDSMMESTVSDRSTWVDPVRPF
jgi:hypothetical protein